MFVAWISNLILVLYQLLVQFGPPKPQWVRRQDYAQRSCPSRRFVRVGPGQLGGPGYGWLVEPRTEAGDGDETRLQQ